MPKHNFVMNLIRGLGNSGLKKILQSATNLVAPGFGDIVLKGGDMLRKFAPGLAERAVDFGLKALPAAQKIAELVADSITEPNATVVPSIVANRAPGLFPGNAPLLGRGDGLLFYGNDQPVPRTLERPIITVEKVRRSLHGNQFMTELPKVEYVPPSHRTAFNKAGPYLGDAVEPPRDASEAGWYFRKVGPGTNIPYDAPGFGEIDSPMNAKRVKLYKDPRDKNLPLKEQTQKTKVPMDKKKKIKTPDRKVKKVKVPEVMIPNKKK